MKKMYIAPRSLIVYIITSDILTGSKDMDISVYNDDDTDDVTWASNHYHSTLWDEND